MNLDTLNLYCDVIRSGSFSLGAAGIVGLHAVLDLRIGVDSISQHGPFDAGAAPDITSGRETDCSLHPPRQERIAARRLRQPHTSRVDDCRLDAIAVESAGLVLAGSRRVNRPGVSMCVCAGRCRVDHLGERTRRHRPAE